jgi:SM-20-related protein
MPPEEWPAAGESALDSCGAIVDELARQGFAVVDGFLSPLLVAQLAREAQALWSEDAFHPAGTGRGDGFRLDTQVRTDHVKWLDSDALTPAQHMVVHRLEGLRTAINHALFLGLFELELHLALYPPGSFYRKHLDQFRGDGQRVVTTILYLNAEWNEVDGGALRLYTRSEDVSDYEDIMPIGGRLVSFLSARFPHEVLPTRRERISITGWFKQRDGLGRMPRPISPRATPLSSVSGC